MDYQQAESRGYTHDEPLAAKLRNAPQELWTTKTGLFVSIAWIVMSGLILWRAVS